MRWGGLCEFDNRARVCVSIHWPGVGWVEGRQRKRENQKKNMEKEIDWEGVGGLEREGREKGKIQRDKHRRKRGRVRKRRVEEGKNNIPSYTVEWRGTERKGALEPWRRCQ